MERRKDSALTLWALRRDGHEPAALITTVTETYDRISMHGVRRSLLARQADAVGMRRLDPSFAGRAFDRQLLADLPASVDPCGENGEFHTFVHAGPIFSSAISCTRGDVIERDGFAFADLIPS
jgi:diphthamide synthase (EF-2-diphthine--ammonia ligase)